MAHETGKILPKLKAKAKVDRTLQVPFLVANTQLYKRLCPSVRWSVGRLVGWSVTLELKNGKTRISAPAHPSATDGRVSGLVPNPFQLPCCTLGMASRPIKTTKPLHFERRRSNHDSGRIDSFFFRVVFFSLLVIFFVVSFYFLHFFNKIDMS